MRKTLSLIFVATASLVSTIGMARSPEGQQRFVRDGQTYVYTAAQVGGTTQVIDGRSYPSGALFHLVVSSDRVSGTSNGTPVSFRLADVRAERAMLAKR